MYDIFCNFYDGSYKRFLELWLILSRFYDGKLRLYSLIIPRQSFSQYNGSSLINYFKAFVTSATVQSKAHTETIGSLKLKMNDADSVWKKRGGEREAV